MHLVINRTHRRHLSHVCEDRQLSSGQPCHFSTSFPEQVKHAIGQGGAEKRGYSRGNNDADKASQCRVQGKG